MVKSDQKRFKQVLFNLIGNAVKFTEKGFVKINVQLSKTEGDLQFVQFDIIDTGIGIAAEYVDSIFDSFTQAGSDITRKFGGTGLGLTISKQLVTLMKGEISVKSDFGKGTTFSVLLPLAKSSIQTEQTKQDLIDKSTLEKLNSVKLLLVEDNEFNRIVARNTLENFNCEVIQCSNGLQAVSLLKTGEAIDVILMDLQMPVMDGFESTIIIRNELKINTPIIALSANAIKSVLEYCKKIGMNDCVTKPFEEEVLIESIYKLVDINHTVLQSQANRNKQDEEALFKLDRLNNLFKGDIVQINRMINIFIEQTEEACQQIGEANAMGNLNLIYQIVHRIKPSIDSMGIASLYQTVRNIEKMSKENTHSNELKVQLHTLLNTLELVLVGLKKRQKN